MRPCSLSCGRGHDASHGPPLRCPERRFEDAGAFAFVYIPCVFVISFWNLLLISFLRIVALHFLSLSCLVPLPFCPFPAFHICPFSTHAQPILHIHTGSLLSYVSPTTYSSLGSSEAAQTMDNSPIWWNVPSTTALD